MTPPAADPLLDLIRALARAAAAMKAAKGKTQDPVAGTILHLAEAYLRSPSFKAHSESYRGILRRHVMAISDKAGGRAMARHLQPKHIAADLAALAPAVGQSRFKAWRALVAVAGGSGKPR